MRVLTDNNISVDAWTSFIEGNVHATPFQSPSYLHFFNSVGGFSAKSYAVDDDGLVKALAVVTVQGEKGPAGLFSRRQIVYGGPLADDNCRDALDMLLKAIDEDTPGGVIYTEIRNLSDFSALSDVFLRNGYEYVPYLNFRVDTSSRESMAGRVSSSRSRQIRKAQQQSVICSEAQNENEVRQFYLLLKELYGKKLHKPLPPGDFFIQFYGQDLGKYLLVRHEEQIIGGIMCPVLPGRALYEFYICGRDDVKAGLYPGVMATWSAMEYAAGNNIPLFDFMGAGRPDEQYGVRDFKARFGGELVEYGRYLKIRKPLLYKTGKAALQFMKNKGK
ncbi:MAG: lipid II:glycine glycyltransferase FemX [Bacteroidales bacterium]